MTSGVAFSAAIVTPIKINLALHIVGERHDGYHLLDSLVCFSFEGDILHYAPSQTNKFSISGAGAKGLAADCHNLVVKARDLLSQKFPARAKSCFFELEKKLPVASGIGGGSGDAAAVFHLLKDQWAIEEKDEEWFKLALSLGADVPMCLSAFQNQKSLKVSGIGEKLQILENVCSLPMVLVNHGQSISTPQIFKMLGKKTSTPLDIDYAKLNNVHSLVDELKKTHNDLYEPAVKIAPELDNVLEKLEETGALLARMSGSGATCFGIYENIGVARNGATKIKAQKPHWFVKAVETTAGTKK